MHIGLRSKAILGTLIATLALAGCGGSSSTQSSSAAAASATPTSSTASAAASTRHHHDQHRYDHLRKSPQHRHPAVEPGQARPAAGALHLRRRQRLGAGHMGSPALEHRGSRPVPVQPRAGARQAVCQLGGCGSEPEAARGLRRAASRRGDRRAQQLRAGRLLGAARPKARPCASPSCCMHCRRESRWGRASMPKRCAKRPCTSPNRRACSARPTSVSKDPATTRSPARGRAPLQNITA